MVSRPWTGKEEKELRDLINQNYTKTQLAEHFDRTVTAIQIKVNRLGLQIFNTDDNTGTRGRNWKDSDKELLKKLWPNGEVSKAQLLKKLNRTWYSVRKMALSLNLGPRPYDDNFISIPDLSMEMQVSYDRIENWFKKGLPRHKNRSGKVRILIDIKELLKYLKEHQNDFDASLISPYLFSKEPNWLIEKRKTDIKKRGQIDNHHNEYTTEEDYRIFDLFRLGFSDEYIAQQLKRTKTAIASRRHLLSLSRHEYNYWELEILRKYSDKKTTIELAKMLPLRTESGIRWKCETLGLPYHLTEEKCNTN